MLPFTVSLQSPVEGVRRFASFSSVATFGVTMHTKSQSILSEIDDAEYWGLEESSWAALRLSPNPSVADAAMYGQFYSRLDDTPTNSQAIRLFNRSFTIGDTSGLTSELHGSEFSYAGNHTGLYLPFNGRVFAPDELIYMSWTGGASSLAWSITWMQSLDPDLLRMALSAP